MHMYWTLNYRNKNRACRFVVRAWVEIFAQGQIFVADWKKNAPYYLCRSSAIGLDLLKTSNIFFE